MKKRGDEGVGESPVLVASVGRISCGLRYPSWADVIAEPRPHDEWL
jgi:hypothetical protein